ncbi:AAA family ATPase [Planococcus halocryophilus]|uniref:AAA family ATPase n=1 Tax=Planococcus halocryophilus TaxID=1215089 RepID=UPI00034A6A9B|nr:SMC family ATPase [Planococcus halocryophilus]
MRPLKLKMTAFGPYKNTEEIDFADLQGNQLFVISGSTGAGKTTIFDGICFALYGSASGSDRSESRILRSDFADDTTHTAVEMEFEIHGKNYRVLRQMSHVKKGNKSPTGERFEFFEVTAEGEKPAVERQIVSEINRRIEEIVGLTQNQFSQIVMLPQGEFRKLLTSETDNKEEILRKIFKTEPYKLISERLKQKKDAAEKIFDREHHKLTIHLQRISSSLPERQSELFEVLSRDHKNINQILDGLEKETAYYKEKISVDEQKYEKAYQLHADKMTAYHEAKKWNDRFEELQTKNDQLDQLVQRQSEYAEKETALQSAERASYIANIESLVIELRNNEIDKNKLLKEAIYQQEQAEQTKQIAEQTFHAQQDLQSERDKLSERLIYLGNLLPTIQEISVKKQQLVQLEETSKQSAGRLKQAEKEFSEQKSQKQQLDKKITELEKILDSSDEMQQELTVVTEKSRVLNDYVLLKEKKQQLQATQEEKKVEFEEIATSYRQLETQWFANQAHVLAGQLHAGDACPVCGSTEHPGANLIDPEQVVTKEQVEVAKFGFDQVDGEYRNVSAKLTAVEEQQENKARELTKLKLEVEQVEKVSTELEQRKRQLTKEIKEQQARKLEVRKWKEQAASCYEKMEQLEQSKQNLAAEVQQHSSSYQTAAAVFENELAAVPEELRELPVLKQQLQQVTLQKQQYEQNWKAAQEQFQNSKEQLASAEVSVRHATNTAKEVEEKRANAQQQFVQALEKSSFESEQAYQQAKMTEAAFITLKKDIQQFNQHRHTLTQQVTELKELLADKKLKDLSQAEIELSELKANYESAFAEQNRSRDFEKIGNELIDSIQSVIEKALEAEKNLNRIADLYNMIRGQNGLKISFERYLQIEYLEQIILSANERLKIYQMVNFI